VRFILYCGEKDVEIIPIPIAVFHELILGENTKRVNYFRWFKNLIHGNIVVLDQVFLTDKVWFHLCGYVNS
jgi:hypothetical protein